MSFESSEYRRAADLFERAVELPEDQWNAFVAAQCDGDDALRSRVKLLDAERQAPQSYLARLALELTARELFDRAASVTGSRLGPYVMGAHIGAGGMGTVYEARDSRLDRKVAIKLLPQAFVSDPDRIARFRKEARAASLLNHPNIVSIYDAGLDQGRHYIATEFVEGQTLRQLEKVRRPTRSRFWRSAYRSVRPWARRMAPELCIGTSSRRTSWCGRTAS